MADLKKLTYSHRGHKGHLGKLLATAQDILDKLSYAKEQDAETKLTDSDAILLEENVNQLRLKATVFNKLGGKIINATTEEDAIETAVFEAADLQQHCLRKSP